MMMVMTGINGESTSMVWPTLGSRTAKEQNRTAGFMIHVTCRLTAKNRDQLRNPTLGNRARATFTLPFYHAPGTRGCIM